MSDATPRWWEVIDLRDEVKRAGGAIDDVQISLHNAVFGKEGIGAGQTPYADAGYYGDITHPTGNLVELMAQIAVRLGVPGSTAASAVWRLDQAMGGGKSHGLVGLWHLATHPEELAATDLGRLVMASAGRIAGAGRIGADLGNPICVVLDCDNVTAAAEDFGPAKRLGERFLWRLFDKDGHRYDEFKGHLSNKAKLAEALRAVGRPVLILVDEIMDYVRDAAARDSDGSILDMAFLRALLDVVNDVENCAMVVVMIASDKDDMVMNELGTAHRREMEALLTRNARTTAVGGGGDFAEIIQRRLFSAKAPDRVTEATANRFLGAMRGSWHTRVFGKGGGSSDSEFRSRVRRGYPFHPDLIALAEEEWSQQAGFQRVRSIIQVFASAAHEQARRAGSGEWAPELIDSGDLPLQSTQLRESLLNSGLVADDRTQANLREVAAVDIVDPHNPDRGAARRLDAARQEVWTPDNPRAAERMATALFVRSLCPRPGGARGATEAELLAASFVPTGSYGTGDAEAVAAELLESDGGAASVDMLPGRGGNPRRWVFETRKTLGMLIRAEKKAISDADRDRAVTERAFELATTGPFDKVVRVEGGDLPAERVTAEGCRAVLQQAGIDDKHSTRLIVLDSRWFSLFNGDDSAARDALTAAMGLGAEAMTVQWASSAVFACAHTAVRSQARAMAAQWLACQRVRQMDAVRADDDTHAAARQQEKEALQQLDRRVRQCYKHIVYLASTGEHDRKVEFRRIRSDDLTALSGSDVWAELVADYKAAGTGTFNKRMLLRNLRENDFGRPLSEIRDSFWNNPHKPLLPGGGAELAPAIYHALQDGDLQLVGPDGDVYRANNPGDVNLASNTIRLRRAVVELPGSAPEPPPGPGPTPGPPGPQPPGPTPVPPGPPPVPASLMADINVNTEIDPRTGSDDLVALLRELAHAVDSAQVTHIYQLTRLTLDGTQGDTERLKALADQAGAEINIRPF